jgi:enoyl-CoA hydratase/carnithine racemase
LGGTVGDGDRVDRRARTDLLLTGRMVGAEEARSMGLVDRVVPAGDVNSAAEALLRAWTKDRSPGLVRILLEAMRNARRLPREDALRLETRLFIQAALEAKQ